MTSHVLLLVEQRSDPCTPRAARIWRTADNGRHWKNVTPAHVGASIQNVGSNRAGQVWFTSGLVCADGVSRVWISDDDGITWRRSTGDARQGCHAGSFAEVQFLRGGRIGFIASADPAGPVEDVTRTQDGGRHWSVLTGLRDPTTKGRGLPALGPTTWTSSTVGFQVGPAYPSGSSYARTNDGKHWQTSRPIDVNGYDAAHTTYSLPSFFSASTGVMEVSVRRGSVAHALIYRTADGGQHWDLVARSPCPVAWFGGYLQDSVTVDAIAAGTWWVMAPYATAAANRLYETCATADGGRTWVRSKPPTHRQNSDALSAASGTTGVVAVRGETATVYLSVDGATWRRLPLPS